MPDERKHRRTRSGKSASVAPAPSESGRRSRAGRPNGSRSMGTCSAIRTTASSPRLGCERAFSAVRYSRALASAELMARRSGAPRSGKYFTKNTAPKGSGLIIAALGSRRTGNMERATQVDRPRRERIVRRRLLQAESVGIRKDLHGIQVDRAQLVTEIAKLMMEQRPSRGRLAARRLLPRAGTLSLSIRSLRNAENRGRDVFSAARRLGPSRAETSSSSGSDAMSGGCPGPNDRECRVSAFDRVLQIRRNRSPPQPSTRTWSR